MNKLSMLQRAIRSMDGSLRREDMDVRHYHAHNCYGRVLEMKAGMTIVGAVHKYSHLAIFLKGKCTVVNEKGENIEVQAPLILECPAGSKRAFHVHEDTYMMTVHGTELTSVEDIENELVCDDFDQLTSEDRKRIEGDS